MNIIHGIYRHSKKGTLYRVIGTATHSETLEDMVIYEAQYDNPVSKIWVRPVSLFCDTVEIGGVQVPRFVFVGK